MTRINFSTYLFSLIRSYPLLLHFSLFTGLFLLLYAIGDIKQLPDLGTLVHWDAGIYETIQKQGYQWSDQGSMRGAGFLPLFPMTWRLLGLNPIGISIVNFVLFASCFIWLGKAYRLSTKVKLLYLSVPSLIFLFIPYAESFFFFSCTLILVGWKKEKTWLIVTGFFLGCLARPSYLYFYPALVFTVLIWTRTGLMVGGTRKNLVIAILASIIGFLLNLIAYEFYTGEALSFFQQRADGNGFSWPVLPLTTWRGSRLLWLDGLAFMVAAACTFKALALTYHTIRNNANPEKLDFALLFTLGFIGTSTIHILFFNITDPIGGTSLMGINRFVFATPFFLLLLHYYYPEERTSRHRLKVIALVTLALLILIGVFLPRNFPNHLRPAVYLILMATFWAYRHRLRWSWKAIYLLQTVLQVIIFGKYLDGLWIG